MNKFIRSISIVTIVTLVLIFIFAIIYFVPRNTTSATFTQLEYGDNFILTMLRLGKPVSFNEGGNGTVFCRYEVDDGAIVYISFSNRLFYLNGAEMVKDNQTIKTYVTKTDNVKTKILACVERSIIGDFIYIIKFAFLRGCFLG